MFDAQVNAGKEDTDSGECINKKEWIRRMGREAKAGPREPRSNFFRGGERSVQGCCGHEVCFPGLLRFLP